MLIRLHGCRFQRCTMLNEDLGDYMRKSIKQKKINKIRKENEEYQKEINDLCLKVKNLRYLISENNRKIEQYENEILFD